MKLGYTLSGGAPVMKQYKIGGTLATAGVPLSATASAAAGLNVVTVTAASDVTGVTIDTGTYSTTQGDAEGQVTVIINPDAVWRMRMAGTATAGSQLTITTNDVAETAGTVIDKTGATGAGDPDPNGPEMLEGTVFCISGANAGQSRKVTTTGATTATVLVPFLNDIASGDEFIIVPWTPTDVITDNVRLTSNLTEAAQGFTVGTGGSVVIVDLEWAYPSRDDARLSSYVHGLFDDHLLTNVT